MLLNPETPDLFLLEEEALEFEDFNLGTEIAKSLVISTTQVAGGVLGFIAVGLALDAGTRLHKRFFKKTKTDEVPDITTMPKAPEH